MKLVLTLSALAVLSACSLYESQGRHTLENSAIQCAQANCPTSASIADCSTLPSSAQDWQALEGDPRVAMEVGVSDPLALRIRPAEAADAEASYNCFHFSSATQMNAELPGAIDLTLQRGDTP